MGETKLTGVSVASGGIKCNYSGVFTLINRFGG